MLKARASAYGVGRKRGDWWKWKVDPMTVDAVMIYAQAGHGRRATLYTDFTFAVRDGEDFVPFTKAYSGLTDAEFAAFADHLERAAASQGVAAADVQALSRKFATAKKDVVAEVPR